MLSTAPKNMSFIGFWPGNCACETAGWVGREMFISEVLTEVHETDGVAVEHVAKRFEHLVCVCSEISL